MNDQVPGEDPGGETWAEARERLLAHARRLTALRAQGAAARWRSERELEAVCYVASVLLDEAGTLPASSLVAQELVRAAVSLLALADDTGAPRSPSNPRPREDRQDRDVQNGIRPGPERDLVEAERKLQLLLQGHFALWEVERDHTLRRVV
jgi:hypothetical protein